MDTIDTIREYTAGDVRVSIRTAYDSDPDYSWLGRFAWDGRDFAGAKDHEYIHHLASGAQRRADSDQWRDEHGRFMEAPEEWRTEGRHGEAKYVIVGDNYEGDPHAYHYAYQDALRLRAMVREQWCFIAVGADVYRKGIRIGSAYLGGVESDSGKEYILEEGRMFARKAIQEARAWLKAS